MVSDGGDSTPTGIPSVGWGEEGNSIQCQTAQW